MGIGDEDYYRIPEEEETELFDDFETGYSKVSREHLAKASGDFGNVNDFFEKFKSKQYSDGSFEEENDDDYTSAVAMKYDAVSKILTDDSFAFYGVKAYYLDYELGKCCSRVYQVPADSAQAGGKTQYGFYAYPKSELTMFVQTMDQVSHWENISMPGSSQEEVAIKNECAAVYQTMKDEALNKNDSKKVQNENGINSCKLPQFGSSVEDRLKNIHNLCTDYMEAHGCGNKKVNLIADTTERLQLLNGMQSGKGEPKLDTVKGTLQRMNARFDTVGHRLFGNSKEFTTLKNKLEEISQKKEPLTVDDFKDLREMYSMIQMAMQSSNPKLKNWWKKSRG